jgi:hypothetical protein
MSTSRVPPDLRRLVRERAAECCEYCLIPESMTLATHAIDHIIAEKHGGLTVAENLALSCAVCNGYKGSDLASVDPETGNIIPLFHPRRNVWRDHFKIAEERIEPQTATGRVTVRLQRFNDARRGKERALLIEAGVFRLPPTGEVVAAKEQG